MYTIICLYIFLIIISALYFIYKPKGLYKNIYFILLIKINLIVLLFYLFFYGGQIIKKNNIVKYLDSHIVERRLKNGSHS